MTRTQPSSGASPRAEPRPRALNVRGFLLISLVCLVAQQALTAYPGDGLGPHVVWLALGGLLLWLVYRKASNPARVIFMFIAFFGAVVYATQIGNDVRALILSLLYVAQALPLMTRPVREHVASRT